MEEKVILYCHPRCGTCRKAKTWLKEHQVEFEEINLLEKHPGTEEIIQWAAQAKREIRQCFNTSGQRYRELNLKEQLKTMDKERAAELLGSDGMLVKRPVLVCEKGTAFGFKEEEYLNLLVKD